MIARALTIAGSDSGGGAGIQADLKTFQELNVFGMSAITVITAQNTLGVQGVYPLDLKVIDEQITSVAEDIGVDAVKTGMLFDEPRIQLIAEKLRFYQWKNVIVDPVMVAKGGASLLTDTSINALIEDLLPLATIATPNIPEAETITGRTIKTISDRKMAIKDMINMGVKNVIIKGGHDEESPTAIDLCFDGENYTYIELPRINTRNTHGTGCTFASAITANIAKGMPLSKAIIEAKSFIHIAITHSLDLGKGHGPTNHGAARLHKPTVDIFNKEVKIWQE